MLSNWKPNGDPFHLLSGASGPLDGCVVSRPTAGTARSWSQGLLFVQIIVSWWLASCFLPSFLPSVWQFGNPVVSLVLANNLGNISHLTGAHLPLRWNRALWTHSELWAGTPAFSREHPWALQRSC